MIRFQNNDAGELSIACHLCAIQASTNYLKINEIGLKVFSFRTVLILNIGSINEEHDGRICGWQWIYV